MRQNTLILESRCTIIFGLYKNNYICLRNSLLAKVNRGYGSFYKMYYSWIMNNLTQLLFVVNKSNFLYLFLQE